MKTLFYFRQCIHSIRYIITYNIFIVALSTLIDKAVVEEVFFLIIFFTYICFCFQGLLELVQAGIEVKCVIIKYTLDIDIIFCIYYTKLCTCIKSLLDGKPNNMHSSITWLFLITIPERFSHQLNI